MHLSNAMVQNDTRIEMSEKCIVNAMRSVLSASSQQRKLIGRSNLPTGEG